VLFRSTAKEKRKISSVNGIVVAIVVKVMDIIQIILISRVVLVLVLPGTSFTCFLRSIKEILVQFVVTDAFKVRASQERE